MRELSGKPSRRPRRRASAHSRSTARTSCSGARWRSRTGGEVLADLADDGPATIRAYEAARIPVTTPASLVLDAAAVEAWPTAPSPSGRTR